MKRRCAVGGLAALSLAHVVPGLAAAPAPEVHMFKSPYCGCCQAWVDHLKGAGFAVKVTEVTDTTAARQRLGMPDRFGSCHTASVGGYVLEGHVPAVDVKRLLAEKPKAIGLAVPGMPVGSPGMEVGARKDPYDVFLIGKDGREAVYARYPK
jgi:hypothetical protein